MVQESSEFDLSGATQEHRPASMQEDQAAGLRNMFGVSRQPRALVLACALDADTSIPLGLGTAHALRKEGLKTLLIDCIPLTERRETLKPIYPVRYDIAQVLKNEVPLDKAIVSAANNLWFSLGIRMRQEAARKKLKTPTLVQRLCDAHHEFDLMLILSNVAESRSFQFFSSELEVVVVASPREDSLVTAMDFIKSLSVSSIRKPIPVIMVGGETEAQGQAAYQRLSQAAESIFAQPLESLGWVSAKPQWEDPQEGTEARSFLLPATVYEKLAARFAQPATGHAA